MPHKPAKGSKKRRRRGSASKTDDAVAAGETVEKPQRAAKKQRRGKRSEDAAARAAQAAEAAQAATAAKQAAGAGGKKEEEGDVDGSAAALPDGGKVVVRGMALAPTSRAPVKYINKQRVLVFCSRGVTSRFRHLMEDLRNMIPHHKKDAKLDSKDDLTVINEVAEMKRCNSCVFLESRKKKDLYLWFSKTPNGPSVKCHVTNVHTMDELRMTGNCLKGSRPFLSFDSHFEAQPHLQLVKEMLCHVFGTPRGHPKSQPFNDHVMSFYYLDNKIWVRHYQVVDVATDKTVKSRVLRAGQEPTLLVEIGPRFVLTIVRIFAGSFGGPTLYQNPHYVSPNALRHQRRLAFGQQFGNRLEQKAATRTRRDNRPKTEDVFADVFK